MVTETEINLTKLFIKLTTKRMVTDTHLSLNSGHHSYDKKETALLCLMTNSMEMIQYDQNIIII